VAWSGEATRYDPGRREPWLCSGPFAALYV